MAPVIDASAVARASAGRSLRLPSGPHRGRSGDVRSASVGSSLELHDFRQYHPGDDVRHLDWNAVARTGEMILRVRQDEVSPRVEVVVDGSRSMALSAAKASRTAEVATWLAQLARQGGREFALFAAEAQPRKALGTAAQTLIRQLTFESREPFEVALRRMPPLQQSGLRIVVSDFLFEADPSALIRRLARNAAGLVLIQVLDDEDVNPSVGAGAKLLDAETNDTLERVVDEALIEGYLKRFAAHVQSWQGAAQQVRAQWISVRAGDDIEALARGALAPLAEAA